MNAQLEKIITIKKEYETGKFVTITTNFYGDQYVNTNGKILNYIIERQGSPVKHKVRLYDGTTRYFIEDTQIKPKTY